MNQDRTCPSCGAPLPTGTAPEMCPRCLLQRGMESSVGDVVVTGARRRREPPPSPEEIQRDFPQLEVLELIGQGGMGVVYKARQLTLDRLVALKILSVDAEEQPAFAERFAREAQALASLHHPHIVGVYDSGRAGERYYLMMEYVDGTDLRAMLRVGRVAPREALAIVSQVCDALQYAHDAGLVHRDIKPENILVDRQGRVKIADFGLAKLLGRPADAFALTGAHQAMGTPHYMAPEQFEHPLEVDHRADIYSLGVVFYELLTGELPLGRFDAPSHKVEIDVRLDEVVMRTLEKDPPRRYQHVSEVKTRIDDISSSSADAGAQAAVGRADAGPERGRAHKYLGLTIGIGVVAFVTATVMALNIPGGVRGGLVVWGPWFAIGFVALTMALVTLARRTPRAARGPAWPWILGGCLVGGPVLVLVAFALLLALSVRPADADAGPFVYDLWDGPESVLHTDLCRSITLASPATAEDLASLATLAQDRALDEHEQLHLLHAMFSGDDQDAVAQAVVTLIQSQELSEPARAYAEAGLDRLSGQARSALERALEGN